MRFLLLVMLLVACDHESTTASTMGSGRWMIRFESNQDTDAGHVLEMANAKAAEVCGGGDYTVEQSTGGTTSNDFTYQDNYGQTKTLAGHKTSTAFVVRCE